MPIARFEMPDGRIARFEVPEGTTPEQAQAQIEQIIAQQQAQQPATQEQPAEPAQQPTAEQGIGEATMRGVDWLMQNTPQGGIISGIASGMGALRDAYGNLITGEDPRQNLNQAVLNSPGVAGAEMALAAGTGTVAAPLSGVAGLAALADSPEAAAAVTRGVQENLTYAPRGETAQQALAPIGRAFEAVTEGSGNLAVRGGEALGIDPNSQAAALLYAAGATAPEALGMALGGVATKVRAKPTRAAAVQQTLDDQVRAATPDSQRQAIPEQPRQTVPEQPVRQPETQPLSPQRQAQDPRLQPRQEPRKQAEIRAAIAAGDKEGAAFRVDQNGRILPDKQAETVIRQGFSDGAVATIKNAPAADKAQMVRMLDIAERGLKNPLERARNRPSDIAGESVMKRWAAVRAANLKARKDIRKAVDTDLRGKQIDTTDVIDSFVDDLAELGVRVTDEGLDFADSQIKFSNTAPIEEAFKRVRSRTEAGQLHQLKQFIDEQIDYDKPMTGNPLSDRAVASLKRLRGRINDKLKAESQAYADANARASETFGVMGDIMDVMGRRFDPQAENAGVMAGQELRKVLSNYQKRADLISAIDKLDETAAKYGAQFGDDPINQVVFLNDLERVFGSFADNSLQGTIEKGAGRVAQAATGRYGVTDLVLDTAGSVINKVYGVNEQRAISSMRELLRRDFVTKE